jgi:hypothetical protein
VAAAGGCSGVQPAPPGQRGALFAEPRRGGDHVPRVRTRAAHAAFLDGEVLYKCIDSLARSSVVEKSSAETPPSLFESWTRVPVSVDEGASSQFLCVDFRGEEYNEVGRCGDMSFVNLACAACADVMAGALSFSPLWLRWLMGIVACEPGSVRLVRAFVRCEVVLTNSLQSRPWIPCKPSSSDQNEPQPLLSCRSSRRSSFIVTVTKFRHIIIASSAVQALAPM